MKIPPISKKALLILSFVFLFLLSFSLTFIYLRHQSTSTDKSLINPQTQDTTETNFIANTAPTAAPSNIFNILLLGNGDPSHEGAALTDSIMVVNLDTISKKVALISIPRDIWISNQKVNAIYLSGRKVGGETEGFRLIKQAVGTITGLPIHYAVLIDFNGFTQAVNSLGEITINVPKTFDDYYYPITGKELDNCGMAPEQLNAINATMSGFLLEKQYTCRYEHLHFDLGKNTMDGQTALKFARSRHSDQDGNDFSRGLRQQAVIIGIKNKLISIDALKKIPTLFDQMKKLVKTDMDLKAVTTLADLIIDPKEYAYTQISLSDQNVFKATTGPQRQYILMPKAGDENWQEVQQYINSLVVPK